MTEEQWLECHDPRRMLHLLSVSGLLNDRKLRLFAVASCRQIWFWLEDGRNAIALQLHERLADGYHSVPRGGQNLPSWGAWPGARVTADWTGWSFALEAAAAVERDAGVEEAKAQADLLRDIVGNPFRRVAIEPS